MEQVQDIYPLSPLQEGILFQTRLAADNTYITQLSFKFGKGLEFSFFKNAWQEIIHRHAILRTAILSEDVEEPLQIVTETVVLPLEFLDWSTDTQDEQDKNWPSFLAKDQNQKIQLEIPPLMR